MKHTAISSNKKDSVSSVLEAEVLTEANVQIKEIIDFYMQNYRHVEIVRCLSCGADMCLWILEESSVRSNIPIHHRGLRRIEIGEDMLSTRKRHDGVMGYLCKCGSNSLMSIVEKGIVPTSNTAVIPSDQPHFKALVDKKMIAEGYKPTIETLGNGRIIVDGFETEVLKNG